jgi:Spy/CpxP family protein refolding chaperone
VLSLVTATAFGSDITATSEREIDPAALEARSAEMRERLALTNEQSEQIKPILIEHFEKTSIVLQDFGINLETGERPEKRLSFRDARQLKSELDVVRDGTNQALSTILSPEQMEEYEEIAEERREEIRSRIKASR